MEGKNGDCYEQELVTRGEFMIGSSQHEKKEREQSTAGTESPRPIRPINPPRQVPCPMLAQ
jgi:hypothetical protein